MSRGSGGGYDRHITIFSPEGRLFQLSRNSSTDGKRNTQVSVEYVRDMETINALAYGTAYRDLHEPAFIVAACFAFIAIILSTILVFQHLRSYNNPAEQKWIVGVILMVPIYATESLLSLWNPKLSLACDILRNCYEAFALYSFGSYLIACLGGERKVVELLEDEAKKPLLEGKDENPKAQHGMLGNFFCQPSVLGEDLLTIEKFGLVQYMILKAVTALLALILELCGVYGDGEFKWNYGYPYIAVVMNFSQMWALYCLVQFYNVTHEKLQPIRPLAKFISFKAIVFATWWQGVGIALACSLGVLPEGKFETGLQDFLICIEMAIAAIAHVFVFSAKPYNFLPISEYGKVTTQTTKETVKLEEGHYNDKPARIKSLKVDTEFEAPGTSVKESIQDIVVEGGQHVVKDVVLTINQAIEPVEKGMTKIQETLQQTSVSEDNDEENQKHETKVEHVEEKVIVRE